MNLVRKLWKPILAAHFVVLGATLKFGFGLPVADSGLIAGDYFAAGFCSAGVLSIGVFSVGVFSIGIVSVGIFPLGVIALGLAPTGILYAYGRFKLVLRRAPVVMSEEQGNDGRQAR